MCADAGPRQRWRALELAVLIEALLASWLVMQVVHEFGHVLHAWYSGGHVTQVVLAPLEFSRTDVFPNPRPQFVAWGGPLWGCVLPVLAWRGIRRFVPQYALAFKFFLGFCLIANGTYLAGGALVRAGDAADLMHHGVAQWILIAVGVVGASAGLYTWHTLGPRMGLASQPDRALRRTVAVLAVVLACTVVAETVYAH